MANFNASADAAILRRAIGADDTDKSAVIDILCRRTNAQRMQIVWSFKEAYGKNLIDEIRAQSVCRDNFLGVLGTLDEMLFVPDCTDSFLNILVALLTPTIEIYARELHDAMNGNGTDENVLIEIMCGLPNEEIRAINYVYYQLYGKILESDIRRDTSGYFQQILVSLSVGNRDESTEVDLKTARTDAVTLRAAGIEAMGTDEDTFIRILSWRNFAQIKLIAQEYERLTGNTLEFDIREEFSGDIKESLLAILFYAMYRPEFFAKRLHTSMSGMGTNDRDLIRLVVTRSEIDMMDIKEEFKSKFKVCLKTFIEDDTSGYYREALFALIGQNN